MTSASTATKPKLSLVIPFYNEGENATLVPENVLRSLADTEWPFELICVNNGSSDDTGDRLQKLAGRYKTIQVVTVPQNQGYGWGIRQGLKYSRGEILGFMVGDGQVRADVIKKAYSVLLENPNRICKVKRVTRNDGWYRKMVTVTGNILFRSFFPSLKTNDINGSPKLFWRKHYEGLDIQSKDWFIDAEIMIKSARMGTTIEELPVESSAREVGESSVKGETLLEFLGNMLRFRVQTWFKKASKS